jgi:hypothetical protein
MGCLNAVVRCVGCQVQGGDSDNSMPNRLTTLAFLEHETTPKISWDESIELKCCLFAE